MKLSIKNRENLFNKAQQKALAMLSFKPYFKEELLKELERDFDSHISGEVLNNLEKLGVINDIKLSKNLE